MNVINNDKKSNDFHNGELIRFVKQQLPYESDKISIGPAFKKGNNLVGEIYRILITDNAAKQKSLILKIAPKDENRRKNFNVRCVFIREIYMYDQVLLYFNDFQLSKGVNPNENGFNECAQCHSTISDELSEALFLEDLQQREFEMVQLREKPITFEHVSLAMQALGKFHAISFALKDQQPHKFKQLSEQLSEPFWNTIGSNFKQTYNLMLKKLLTCLEEEKRNDLLDRFNRMIDGIETTAKIYHLISSASAEPYSVICHGDLTTNNSMFRNNKQGKPIEIQLIDWQFSRYACPVTELVIYLLCSTTKQLRDKYYEDFLQIYYNSLSDFLMRLGSDPSKLFPYDVFQDQLRKFGVYSVFVGALLLPLTFAESYTVPNVSEVNACDNLEDLVQERMLQMSDDSRRAYNQIVVDLFDDLAHLDYI